MRKLLYHFQPTKGSVQFSSIHPLGEPAMTASIRNSYHKTLHSLTSTLNTIIGFNFVPLSLTAKQTKTQDFPRPVDFTVIVFSPINRCADTMSLQIGVSSVTITEKIQ